MKKLLYFMICQVPNKQMGNAKHSHYQLPNPKPTSTYPTVWWWTLQLMALLLLRPDPTRAIAI